MSSRAEKSPNNARIYETFKMFELILAFHENDV